MTDPRVADITRAVIATARTVGRGTEPLDFDFAHDVLKKAKYPHSWYFGVACRVISMFAEGTVGQTYDEVLQDILDQLEEDQ